MKFVVGVLLLPACLGATQGLARALEEGDATAGWLRAFGWGVGLYLLLHIVFYKPTPLFTLSHRILQAVATWLFGGKVAPGATGGKGGGPSGAVSAGNKGPILAVLSPYLIPIYTLLAALGFRLAALRLPLELYSAWVVGGLAWLTAFHLVQSLESIQRNENITHAGYLISVSLVYLVTLSLSVVAMSWALPGISLGQYLRHAASASSGLYVAIVRQLFS